MTEATEAEMREHCDKYACGECPIQKSCSLFETLTGCWLINKSMKKLKLYCPHCGDNNTREIMCETCMGTGSTTYWSEKICPDCHGRGTSIESHKCLDCGKEFKPK
jgi:DnaJ-class molecular chaperone